jgi:putative membrane protein
MIFLVQWLIAAVAVLISAYILPGVTVKGFFAALVTALVLGLINAFLRPVLLILTLPITVLTLGLFYFVINALLIMLTGAIVPGFEVRNFWWALLFGLVLSIVNSVLGRIAGGEGFYM